VEITNITKYKIGESFVQNQISKFPLIITTAGVFAISAVSIFLAWLLFNISGDFTSLIEKLEQLRALYYENPDVFTQEDLNRMFDKSDSLLNSVTNTIIKYVNFLVFIGIALAGIAFVQIVLLLNAKRDYRADA